MPSSKKKPSRLVPYRVPISLTTLLQLLKKVLRSPVPLVAKVAGQSWYGHQAESSSPAWEYIMNLMPAAWHAGAIAPMRSRVAARPGLAGPPSAVTMESGDDSGASRWYPHQLIDQITYAAPVAVTMSTNAETLKSAAC